MIFNLLKITTGEGRVIRKVDQQSEIKIGHAFQAEIPDVVFENDEFANEDNKLWDPSRLPEEQVNEYLKSMNIRNAIEEERALWILHTCNYNTDEALRRQRHTPPMMLGFDSDWSEHERNCFERGLGRYGKNFTSIQRHIRSKSVGDCVEYYYYWKHERMRNAHMNGNS